MIGKNKQIVYYSKLICEDWNFYLAATEKGLCFVGSQNETITEVEDWVNKKIPKAVLKEDKIKLSNYVEQFEEYFLGKRQTFNFSIDLYGTPFQKFVWMELQNIPYGEICSYSDIAKKLNKPSAVRAVGSAIGANPVMIVVPCHRVLSKSGKLTGFRGGLTMKKRLLDLEQSAKAEGGNDISLSINI